MCVFFLMTPDGNTADSTPHGQVRRGVGSQMAASNNEASGEGEARRAGRGGGVSGAIARPLLTHLPRVCLSADPRQRHTQTRTPTDGLMTDIYIKRERARERIIISLGLGP